MLRARFANPAISSITKTDGLTYKISEIVTAVAKKIDLPETTILSRKQSILAAPQRS